MNETVYILGIVLQAVAAIIAMLQVRQAPRKLPWLLIALSSLLIVARRTATLEQFMAAGRPLATAEVLTLVISVLFFLGVALMSKMFREVWQGQQSLRQSEAALGQTEAELRSHVEQLQQAVEQVKTLRGILPICSGCKRIRDDQGYWNQVDAYLRAHTEAEFSHSMCPECVQRLYPWFQPT
jgi:hypothetical protein